MATQILDNRERIMCELGVRGLIDNVSLRVSDKGKSLLSSPLITILEKESQKLIQPINNLWGAKIDYYDFLESAALYEIWQRFAEHRGEIEEICKKSESPGTQEHLFYYVAASYLLECAEKEGLIVREANDLTFKLCVN